MPRQLACDRLLAKSALWPLWPPGQDPLGETLVSHKDTGETDEEKETTPGMFTIFTKTNYGKYPSECECANYRATQHSLEILRPTISRSTPPRLSNETSQRTARVARKWARKLQP